MAAIVKYARSILSIAQMPFVRRKFTDGNTQKKKRSLHVDVRLQ